MVQEERLLIERLTDEKSEMAIKLSDTEIKVKKEAAHAENVI